MSLHTVGEIQWQKSLVNLQENWDARGENFFQEAGEKEYDCKK